MDDLAAAARHRPDRAAPQELDRARGVPLRRRSRGLTYDCGNYEAATDEGARAVRLRRRCAPSRQQRRDVKDPVQLGIGISTYTEMCGLAPSPLAAARRVRRRRLGARDRPDAADRQGRGRDGHVAARPGPRDDVQPDRRRRARRRRRRRRVILRRHRHRAVRLDTYGSRSLVVGGMAVRRGRRAAWWRRPGCSPRTMLEADPGDLEFDAGAFRRQGHARRRRRRSRRSRSRRSPPTTCPTASSRPCRPTRPDRPGDLLLPARHPPVRGRGRHRDRHDEDPQVRLRRRHRQGRQPDDRRGPGARRRGAGHRAGALRGGRLRRRRQPGHRQPGRLPGAGRARPAVLRRPIAPRRRRPRTRSGVKGVGEAGTIASTPAVVNAVVDAVRQFGVDDVRMALHPGTGVAGDPGREGGRWRRRRRPRRGGHRRLRRRHHRDDGGRRAS